MSIDARLSASLAELEQRTRGQRTPKAFYLSEADWAEFTSSPRDRGSFPFGNNPPRMVEDFTFCGIPVRPSRSAQSRLYDHTTAGRTIAQ